MDQLQVLAAEIIGITNKIVASFGPLVGYTKLIIGLGALFIIVLKTANIVATGQSVKDNLPALAKPLFLLALVIFYNGILGIIGMMLSPISAGTDGMAIALMTQNEAMETKFYKDLDAKYGVVEQTAEQKQAEADADAKKNMLDKTIDGIEGVLIWLKNFGRFFTIPYILGGFLSIIQIICNFILKVSFLGILLLRSINLAILIIFGPIAIALSVWSPMADNWKPWIVNYVSKYMWLPVAQVTLAACYTIKNSADQKAYDVILKIAEYSQGFGPGIVEGSMAAQTAAVISVGISDFAPVMMTIGLTIISIVTMTQVPNFTALIISGASQGMNSVPSPGYFVTKAAMSTVGKPLSMASSGLKKSIGLGGK